MTGVAAVNGSSGRTATEHAVTFVRMRGYSDTEIDEVVEARSTLDKAGAYAIQDEEFHPVTSYTGCYFNVVGLPLCSLARVLRRVRFHRRPFMREGLMPECCVHCPERNTLE